MKWRGRQGSRNIEDRRRSGGGVRAAGGIGGFGLIAVLAIGYFLGVDVTPFLNLGGSQVTSNRTVELTPEDEQAAQFVSVTLADTETVWAEIFEQQLNATYRPATMVLFKGATQSPCGGANGASGPFYCPTDRKAYLDTDFFTTLSRRLGASGDFAAAYVVAHEIAHHVQNELGILAQANKARSRMGQAESNRVSVMIELQADCFSGIWARYAQDRLGTLERGDFDEALNAARQIGDDTLQRNAGQRPNPHSFTHGTSAQRQNWFQRGFETADIQQCDTFGASSL
ncbi:KPN_02809 family neutral zinc metallopeptidase [Neptunicoccus cionae]|uniref:Membrane protein n=1 Tax=Neptunicoccus cionae TaxID=2035344 RepID=A0A916VQA4_9RHOB|nr:neutral zinc metallopeptidase [Amylibacter cionae]GGA21038.1 membrane protein [Amylibacter cionae]